MRISTITIEDKVNEFLKVLAMDAQQLQATLTWLNEMRGLVIKHDDLALQKLLETVQAQASRSKNNELKRQRLRGELAIFFDCDSNKMTLTRLELELSGEQKAQVAQVKLKLQELVKELKDEHLKTTMLLSDCSRFNSLLLENVLEFSSSREITYSPNGFAERHSNAGFVNLQF